MSDKLLEKIRGELQKVQGDITDLESTNRDNLQNIYLDVDDINVANETLERLIGGTDGSFTYGLNDLLTSSNTKLDIVNTSVTASNTKLDTIDSVLDNMFIDTTAIKGSLNTLDNAISSSKMQVDVNNISTIATEATVDDIKTELESIDTHLANLEYGSGSEWYVKTKSNDILADGSTAPSNTPFLPIGGVDVSGNAQVLKTTTSGNLLLSVEGAVRLESGLDSGVYPQIGTVGLVAGTASIGKVGLNAGTASIGSVTVTSAPTTAITHSALTELGSSINSNKVDVNLTNASVAVTGTVTTIPSGTQTVSHTALTDLDSAIVSSDIITNRDVATDTSLTGIQIHHPALAKFDYALDLLNSEVKFDGSTAYRVISTNIMNRDLAVTNDALTELGNSINSNKVDVNLTNASVAVTGTFWQNTQPVSIAGTVEVVQDTSADLKVTEVNSSTISTRVNNAHTAILTTNTKIDTLDGSVDAVKTSVDAIKGASSNISTLYDLKGVLDSIEANTDTLEVKIAEVDVNTDGLETLQTSTNTKIDTTNTKLDTTITSLGKIDDVHGTDNTTAPTKGTLVGGKDGTGKFQDLLMDTSGRASVNVNGTVPVSGTVTSTPSGTQTITGTVTANAGTGTQAVSHDALTELGTAINSNDQMDINIASGGFDGAVTGTFWQTTQPVSGTFWQATQPISHSALTELGNAITGNKMQVDIVSMPTTTVTGTVTSTPSGTQAISHSALTELGTAIAGNEMQVDVITMPTITETNSSAIDTKIGTVNTNLGTLETSTDKIRGTGSNVKNLYDLHGVLATINTSVSTSATNSANLTNISTKSTNIATSAGSINSDTTSMSSKLTDVNTNLGTLETSTDSIRGSGASVASLYDLKGVLDAVKTNTEDIEVVVGDIDVNTDGLEVLQASTNTKLDTAITSVAKIDDVHGADNTTAPTKGILIGGKDSTGKFQDAYVGTTGRLEIDVNSVPTTAVTGTFWQNTQPVSGTVTATPSGTQAVSNAGLTELASAISGNEMQVDVITMPTVAVTGAFYPGTQPVSGTVTETNSANIKSVLDSIKTNTDDIEVVVGDIDVNTDGLEVLQASTNTKLDTTITAVQKIDDVHGTDGSTAPTKGNLIGGKDGSGNFQDLLMDTSGRASVNINGTVPVSGTVTSTPSGTQAVSHSALTELGTAINSSDQMDINIASGGFDGAVTGTFWQTTQPVSGTVTETNSTAIKTAVEKIDNAITGNEMQVDVVTMPTTAVTGAFYPATQPVSGTVTSTPSGTQTITGTVTATPSGTQTVSGTVAVTNAGLDAINDVHGTDGSTAPTKGTLMGGKDTSGNYQDFLTGTTGYQYAYTYPQGTTTVDGTVAVTNAGLTELASAISGNEMQVDVLTMPTITETNSSAIKTAVEKIDNAISGNEMQVDIVSIPTVTETNSANIKSVLDAIKTNTDDIEVVVGDIDVNTDGMETLQTSTNTKLDTMDGVLDNIDTASTVGSGFTNGSATIGTSSAQMTSTSFTCNKGVTVTADMSNTGTLYVGNATGVTTSTGFPLEAGDAMFLPIANPTLVYIISDTASQKVLYIAV